MAKLQDIITDLHGRSSSLEGRAASIEGRATSLEGKATNLEGKATSLEGRAANLEGKATSLEGRATNLESRTTSVESRSANLESRVLSLRVKLFTTVVVEFNQYGRAYLDIKPIYPRAISDIILCCNGDTNHFQGYAVYTASYSDGTTNSVKFEGISWDPSKVFQPYVGIARINVIILGWG